MAFSQLCPFAQSGLGRSQKLGASLRLDHNDFESVFGSWNYRFIVSRISQAAPGYLCRHRKRGRDRNSG